MYIFLLSLKKNQIVTYLLENMSSLNLRSFAGIMRKKERSQSNFSTNFSNNPRKLTKALVLKT